MKIKPVIEQYIYEKSRIQVGVKIDYTKKEISLVEHTGKTKEYLFGHRGLEYIQGWLNILHVMEEAIKHAQQRLKAYGDKELDDFTNLLVAVHSTNNSLEEK